MHWYDRQKMILKEIHNVQYVACMNPTAGSFTINTRLQRHFSVFAISFPQVRETAAVLVERLLHYCVTMYGTSTSIPQVLSNVYHNILMLLL